MKIRGIFSQLFQFTPASWNSILRVWCFRQSALCVNDTDNSSQSISFQPAWTRCFVGCVCQLQLKDLALPACLVLHPGMSDREHRSHAVLHIVTATECVWCFLMEKPFKSLFFRGREVKWPVWGHTAWQENSQSRVEPISPYLPPLGGKPRTRRYCQNGCSG